MANVAVYNMEGKEVGTLDLNDAVFGVEVNEHLYTWQLFGSLQISVREHRRQRHVLKYPEAEENRGDRKEQVTQDRDQQAPQWTGGGVVFAPIPRDYSFKLNKKEKRAALKSALTSRVQEKKLIVVDELKFDEIKTKNFKKVKDNLKVSKGISSNQ